MSPLAFRKSTAVAIAFATLGFSTSSFAQDTTPSTGTSAGTTPSTTATPSTTPSTMSTPTPESGASTSMTASMFAPTNPSGGEITGVSTIRPNRALLTTGASLLVGSYVTSAIIGGVNDRDADKKLYIPVVGPWLDLNERNCTNATCSHEDWSKAALIASGAAQGLGVILALTSLVVPEHVANADIAKVEKPKVNVTPMQMGFAGYGMGATGTF